MSKVFTSKTLNRKVVSFQGKEYPVNIWGPSDTPHPIENIDRDIKEAVYLTTKRTLMSVLNNPNYTPTFTYVEHTNEYFVNIAYHNTPMNNTSIGMVDENDLDAVKIEDDEEFHLVKSDFAITTVSNDIFSTVPSPFFFDERIKKEQIKPTEAELVEAFNTGPDLINGLEAVFKLGQKHYLAK